MLKSVRLNATTNEDGDATVNDVRSCFGELYAVEWIDGDFDDGVNAVLSVQNVESGVAATLLTLTAANVDVWYYPRALQHGEAGAALTGTAGGDRTRRILNGTLRLSISAGGDTKSGGCIVYYLSRE